MKIAISIRVEGTTDKLQVDHETSTEAIVLLRGALGDNLRAVLRSIVEDIVNDDAQKIIEFVDQESQLEEMGRERAALQREIERKKEAIARNKRGS